MNYLFISLDIALLFFVLVLGTYKPVNFMRRWKSAFLAGSIMAIVSSLMSLLLTSSGIIGFNPEFSLGLIVYNLPIEELLFYFSFPLFSIFIYENLKYYFRKTPMRWTNLIVKLFIPGFCLFIALLEDSGTYTLAVLGLTTLTFVLWSLYPSLQKIAATYLICLLPYLLTRYLLIGTEINPSSIWHNESHQLSIKIGTLPMEEIADGFALIVASTILYEIIQKLRLR
ncbi:MAG: lycopene cyclase domain-containing protein [Flavobacteriaceae bacterium]|jgi:lycopene cyclase domain-containing protein